MFFLSFFFYSSLSVFSVDYNDELDTLVSGSADFTVKVWALSAGACLNTLTGHTEWVTKVILLYLSTLFKHTSNVPLSSSISSMLSYYKQAGFWPTKQVWFQHQNTGGLEQFYLQNPSVRSDESRGAMKNPSSVYKMLKCV